MIHLFKILIWFKDPLSLEGNIKDLRSWGDSLTIVFICKTLFNGGKLKFTNADHLSVFVFNYTLTINLPC